MSLEAKLFSALTTSTLVTSDVGTRVYPLILPQEPTYPAITYQRITNTPINTILGYSTMSNPAIEVNVWSTSYNTSKNIRENVHKVLDETTYMQTLLLADRDLFDEGINTEKTVYRVSMDFSVWGVE